jgi:hypothetical protein
MMATWVMHTRIAEILLNEGYRFAVEPFLIGNVAPDAGSSTDFHAPLNPPKHITHWYDSNGVIDAESFYSAHVADKPLNDPATSFFIGYYFHLLADMEWQTSIWRPLLTHPEYGTRLQTDINFLEKVYDDAHTFDYMFLEQHPNFIYHRVLATIDTAPYYLDYLPTGLLTNHVRLIQSFYATPRFDYRAHLSLYMPAAQFTAYIDKTAQQLKEVTQQKFPSLLS